MLNKLTAEELRSLIQSGEVTSAEILADCLGRIRQRQPRIGAFVALDDDHVMARAREEDARREKGVLAGIPFAIKDIMNSARFPTTWGSRVYSGRRPDSDAACVHAFQQSGGVAVGMSLSTEFACFQPGATVNPHNPKHTPGGSSSGSAAAVADFMVPLAFGSQTAASVVRPAAFCGVFAYKASCGYFDLTGVMTLAPSLDSLGVFARSVVDLELAHRALLPEGRAANEVDTGRLSVALMRGPHWHECSSSQKAACVGLMDRLRAHGLAVNDNLEHPAEFCHLAVDHRVVMCREIAQHRRHEFTHFRSRISENFATLVEFGLAISVQEYAKALRARDLCLEKLDRLLASHQVIVTPAAHGEAPQGLETTGDPLFSRMWTLLQVPSVTIPVGRGPNGLPLAVQLVGGRNKDSDLLQYAAVIARVVGNQDSPQY